MFFINKNGDVCKFLHWTVLPEKAFNCVFINNFFLNSYITFNIVWIYSYDKSDTKYILSKKILNWTLNIKLNVKINK